MSEAKAPQEVTVKALALAVELYSVERKRDPKLGLRVVAMRVCRFSKDALTVGCLRIAFDHRKGGDGLEEVFRKAEELRGIARGT